MNRILIALTLALPATAFAEQTFLLNQWFSNGALVCQYSNGAVTSIPGVGYCQQSIGQQHNSLDTSLPLQVKQNAFSPMDMLQLQNQLLQNELLQRQLQK
jgi:hypothetical protein